MDLENSYYWIQRAFSPEECQKVIDHGLSKVIEDAHTAGGRDVQGNYKIPQNAKTNVQIKKEFGNFDSHYIRDSKVAWIDSRDLSDRLWDIATDVNKEAGWNFDVDWSEPIQFTKYEKGGFYGYHRDGSGDRLSAYRRYIRGVTPLPYDNRGKPPKNYCVGPKHKFINRVRKLSMTINLSPEDSYEGGDLLIDLGEHHESGDNIHTVSKIKPQGSVCVFPSFMPHCVTPVTKGVRYSLVMWLLGRPFK